VILRRLYLYLVSAAALTVLAVGLIFLGGTVVLFLLNDPSANSSRAQLALFSAMTVVALPVWAVHLWFAQRFASRDPYERASALRRLYVYWACFAGAVGAAATLAFTLSQVLVAPLDGRDFSHVSAAQTGWAAVVLAVIWGFHFALAGRDRAAAGEEGASSTLRRWYMYAALLIGLLMLLTGTATVLQVGWTKLFGDSESRRFLSVAGPAGSAIAGGLLWAVHGRIIAMRHLAEDRHSTLRAVEGFIAVAVSIATALSGAAQILYYILARLLGESNPGNAGPVLVAVAAPGSQVLVFGTAWVLLSRRLARDARGEEADRQAAIRRLYTNLACLISLAAWSSGVGGLLWAAAEQLEAPIIGVKASDWRDPVSIAATLVVVGGAVWAAYWRHAPWAADRQSLSRKLYVWAALLGSILAILAAGVAMANVVFQQAFAANPRLNDPGNLDFGHYLAVVVVAAGVALYHWRVLRADAAARPHRAPAVAGKHPPIADTRPVTVVEEPRAGPVPAGEVVGPQARRYTLVVTDATDDDVHQALSTLPPQSSYRLTAGDQPE
jgi:Domain of unknown function (DUF5671)